MHQIITHFELMAVIWGWGYSTAVENTPASNTLMVVGSHPARCIFSYSSSFDLFSISSYFPSPVECP